MENQQIFDKLNSIVKSINVNAVINETTALVGDSILDSLEFMNYITKVEEAFKISISDSEISGQQLGILYNMTNYISSKTNNN
jgi:acyl carrier protein